MVERIDLNQTNPSPSLPEGERSTVKHPHPFLTDPAVRKALSMAIDRQIIAELAYGPAGKATCTILPSRKIPTWLPSLKASLMSCVIKIIVLPIFS